MDGVDSDRHRLWNAVNIKTKEKRLISSANILAIKKRAEKKPIKEKVIKSEKNK